MFKLILEILFTVVFATFLVFNITTGFWLLAALDGICVALGLVNIYLIWRNHKKMGGTKTLMKYNCFIKSDGIHCYADLKEITDISELAPFFMLFANNGDTVQINMCPPLEITTKGETNVSEDT